MSCSTCSKKSENQEELNLKLVPDNILSGDFSQNFFFKLVAFLVIVVAIPLVILVIVLQIFFSFFLPKKLPKLNSKIKSFFLGIFSFYTNFKYKREIKKRQNQFEKTKSYNEYDENQFSDVEVHNNEE
jgi:hypothetical protein